MTMLPTLCVCQVQINCRRPRRDYAQEQALSSWPKWHPRTSYPLHVYSFLDISFFQLDISDIIQRPPLHQSTSRMTLTQQIDELSNQSTAHRISVALIPTFDSLRWVEFFCAHPSQVDVSNPWAASTSPPRL